MKVIICGAGQVGFGIASHLAGEGNDVTVVESAPDLMARIRDQLDVRPILGHGAHPDVLAEAGAQNADILIAVTASDEVNMVACQIAKSSFGVKKCIARVRDSEYSSPQFPHIFGTSGIPVDVLISPEREVGEAVLRRLAVPAAFDNAGFADGLVQLVGIAVDDDCPVIDTPLNQLTGLFPDLQAIVVGLEREGKCYVPEFDDLIIAGDLVYLVTSNADLVRTLKIFGHEEKAARSVIIVGGGNIGLQVARGLEESGQHSIRIIEGNAARAQAVAEMLSQSIVLHGDGLNPELLSEAGVRDAELVLAVTNDDQVNILTTMLALQAGCQRGLCIINNDSFQNLASGIGMEMAINPRAITVSSVLSHVRRGRILRLHAVSHGGAEVIETRLDDGMGLIGEKIRECDFPTGVRVGAIARGGEMITPRGNSEFALGDHIILFVMSEHIDYVENLFADADS